MTTYFEYHVNLSDGQKANLAKAIESKNEIILRLKNNQLQGNDELMLTKWQIKKKLKKPHETRQESTSKFQKRKSGNLSNTVEVCSRVFCLWGQGDKGSPTCCKTFGKRCTFRFGESWNEQDLWKRAKWRISGPKRQNRTFNKKQKPVNTKTKRTHLEQSPIRRASCGETNAKTTRRSFGHITCKYRNSFGSGTGKQTLWQRLASRQRLTRSIKRKRTPSWSKTRYDVVSASSIYWKLGESHRVRNEKKNLGEGSLRGQGILFGKNSPFAPIPILGEIF